MLAIRDLRAAYDGIEALRGVSLEVQAGAMVALVGANGAGKSTLLNSLSGIVPAAAGSVVFEGEDITRVSAHKIARRGLLHVPEGRQILVDLSVEENLRLGALAARQRARRATMDTVLALFPILKDKLRQQAGALSGGQQQMLAIGRALMGEPRMLLLDEPSLGLAPLVTDQVFAALRTLNAGGLTILLVEQNARRAFLSTSWAYLLDQGTIAKDGPSAALAQDAEVIARYLGHLAAGEG